MLIFIGVLALALFYALKYFVAGLFLVAAIRWVKWVWED